LNFKNKEHLIQALIECWGFTKDQIEVHDQPQQIYDYCGHATSYRFKDTQDERFANGDKAHIIIRRHNVGGMSNDIGFYIEDNPTEGKQSVMFVSDYDRGRAKTNEAAIGKLTQRYVVLETKQEYADQGVDVIEQEHNGEVLLYVKVGN
jgi:hypothetical protein